MVCLEYWVSFAVCLTGTCWVQHQRTSQKVGRGIFRWDSQVCDRRENLVRHVVHQNRCLSLRTVLLLHKGQKILRPNTILRKYLRICASDGTCRNGYIVLIVYPLRQYVYITL